MKTTNILIAAYFAAMALTLTGCPTTYTDDDTPADSAGYIVTHDQALAECEALDLIYDYEAEGDTPSDYCITQEEWDRNSQAD